MPTAAWLEIPDFAVRFAAACLSGTFKYLFLIVLLITQKRAMLIATIPFFSTLSALVFNLSFYFCAIPTITLPHKDSL